jgi:hypothetical protein
MKTTPANASQAPAKLPTRRKPSNLTKILEAHDKLKEITYKNSREFDRKNVISQIRGFCNSSCSIIKDECVVSVMTDKIGCHVIVVAPDFRLSFIYEEGATL